MDWKLRGGITRTAAGFIDGVRNIAKSFFLDYYKQLLQKEIKTRALSF